MSKTKPAIIWAVGIIAFALLGAVEIVSQDVAKFGVIALPVLAAVTMLGQRPDACGRRASS